MRYGSDNQRVKRFPCGVASSISETPYRVRAQLQASTDAAATAAADQKIQNAEKGVEAFLGTMDPQADNVGLAILPAAKDSASVCSLPQSSNYDDPNAPYVVVPLSNDYETGTGALDSSSRLVSTLRCVQAGGQTAYANALDAAKAELDGHGRPGVQKVIVIRLGLDRLRPGRSRRPDCGKQVAATSRRRSSPTRPLQEIASPGNYYAEPQPSSLAGIFLAISADLGHGTSRLNG